MNIFQQVREEVEQFEKVISKCVKVERCDTSTGHIEVTMESEDPQEARPIIQALLDNKFPGTIFRLVFYRV